MIKETMMFSMKPTSEKSLVTQEDILPGSHAIFKRRI